MCSLTSPTNSPWNDEWIKQEADRIQLDWHRQEQQPKQREEEQKRQQQEEMQRELLLLLQSQRHADTVQQSDPGMQLSCRSSTTRHAQVQHLALLPIPTTGPSIQNTGNNGTTRTSHHKKSTLHTFLQRGAHSMAPSPSHAHTPPSPTFLG